VTAETCGVVATCGRWKDHRGQHGGFRPVRPSLVDRDVPAHRLGRAPSPRQLEILAEIIIHAGHGPAAACLGLSLQTVKNTVDALHARIGATDNRQAAYLLGWTRLPEGVVREHGA
jgi:hypothetical protein